MKNLLISGALGGLGSPMTDYFSSNGYQVLGTTSLSNTGTNSKNIKYYPINLIDENATNQLIKKLKKEYKNLEAAILLAGGFAVNNL